ncbi:hypothetical protein BDR26DRAFT_848694 [Obelidium mucronatum]|nr:hypothetical protein BDR26DRAFT_848694 [Obelidium mucronatum]
MSLKRSRPLSASSTSSTSLDHLHLNRTTSLPIPAKPLSLENSNNNQSSTIAQSIEPPKFTRSLSTSSMHSQKTLLGSVHRVTSLPLLSSPPRNKQTSLPPLPLHQQQQRNQQQQQQQQPQQLGLHRPGFASWLSEEITRDPELALNPKLSNKSNNNNIQNDLNADIQQVVDASSSKSSPFLFTRGLQRTRSFYRRVVIQVSDGSTTPELGPDSDESEIEEEEEEAKCNEDSDDDDEAKDIGLCLFDAITEERPSFEQIMQMDREFQDKVALRVAAAEGRTSPSAGNEKRRLVPPRIERSFSLPLANDLEMWLVDQIYTVSYQKLNQGRRPLADEVVVSNLIKSLAVRFPVLIR